MSISIYKNVKSGPFWPLGNIAVPTPGTPVGIMSLVDPSSLNAPETPTSATNPDGFTVRFQQIFFQAVKAGGGPPRLAVNTGNIFVVLKPLAASGASVDTGNIIKMLVPGETWYLSSSAMDRNSFGPYQLFIDADTPGDACQVCGEIA